MFYPEQEEYDIVSYDELLEIIPNKYKLSLVISKRLQQLLDYQVSKDPAAKIDKKELIKQVYDEIRNNSLVIEENEV
ncbi:MAG: hypothetical protein CVV64_05285 [Candidatus Wallbacteria bacterium HGW-Wallbacteria-1]|jgi:DNA-directed RNA polymerase subunit K/omega|uniref:DNA-directed RNA polymerase subunit omega n=1 Tax=Candidatus Wallbacteria bacterium HGW-Wallbacteria-1 TaxID=2013854 RepID=A0A2N1PS70_9BACT|nr:MAG: hypothetical protein CVV64_05285 [Candidatus Wallbacteria bacterium HGW-Wallbacteria-1]